MTVSFECNLKAVAAPLSHAWEHTVGSGRALLALRADWQEQLKRAHAELGFRYIRFHGLLNDDMGTLVCHENRPLYSFFNIDRIFDFLLSIGMKPFIELSFMPAMLASGSQTVFSYRGNVTPPRDYGRWRELIARLVRHWLDRYGAREVGQWFFEVWNEPNLDSFWSGGQEAYFELYRSTVETIKGIDPGLKVGGPASAQNAWIPEFLDFCRRCDLPADFVTTHYYPTDAFGKIGADTITQLEHAPRDVMRERAREAKDAAQGVPLYYTEWNVTSNPRDPLHDQAFAAAFASRIALSVQDLVEGYSFWTFTDIFEENYFPSVPFHGGFGLLNLHGIAKPVYRAFELLHRLGDELYPVKGAHPTVNGWVGRAGDKINVFLTNQAMPRHPICSESVAIRLLGAAPPRTGLLARIDEDHVNPERAWREMGEPEYLLERELHALAAASALRFEPYPLSCQDGAIEAKLMLSPQAVALLQIEFAPGELA